MERQQGDNSPAITGENTFAFRDMLSKMIGNKAFKFGFEFSREQDNDGLIGGARPDLVFKDLGISPTERRSLNKSKSIQSNGRGPDCRGAVLPLTIYSAFVQNDWKLRPNLTINIGSALGILCSADRG